MLGKAGYVIKCLSRPLVPFTPQCDTIKKSYLSTTWNYIISCAVEFSGLYGLGSTEEGTTMKLANAVFESKNGQNLYSSHILPHKPGH